MIWKSFKEYINLETKLREFQNTPFRNTPEVNDPISLPVEGTIPEWLSGVLYRTGTVKSNLFFSFFCKRKYSCLT